MKYTSLVIDFSRVLIFSNEDVKSLNDHHKYLSQHMKGYRVLDHFYLNYELLTFLTYITDAVHLYLFSDGSLHKLPEINAQVHHLFKRIVPADELGLKKYDPEAYIALLELLGEPADRTVFLDYKQANVDAATEAGIHAIQYHNNEQALRLLRGLFGN